MRSFSLKSLGHLAVIMSAVQLGCANQSDQESQGTAGSGAGSAGSAGKASSAGSTASGGGISTSTGGVTSAGGTSAGGASATRWFARCRVGQRRGLLRPEIPAAAAPAPARAVRARAPEPSNWGKEEDPGARWHRHRYAPGLQRPQARRQAARSVYEAGWHAYQGQE